MREIDKLFLNIFRDLTITEISTPNSVSYVCKIGKDEIPHRQVVALVKNYQDEIVKMLLGEK